MVSKGTTEHDDGYISLDHAMEQLPRLMRVKRAWYMLNQKEAAKQIGISNSCICRLEAHRGGMGVANFVKCLKWLGYEHLSNWGPK